MKARILGLHAEDPSLSVRRIAARVIARTGVSVSRETVRKLLRSAEEALVGSRPGAYAADQAPAGSLGRGGESVALSAVLPMTEADHAKFDSYRGAIYESPGVWWTGR